MGRGHCYKQVRQDIERLAHAWYKFHWERYRLILVEQLHPGTHVHGIVTLRPARLQLSI